MHDHAEIERRLGVVEERLELEAGLRASQDRDLASLKVEMRSANRLLQALAVSQSEQTRTLARHGELLASQGERLDRQAERLDRQGERLDRIEGGVFQILGMLDHLVATDGRPDGEGDAGARG